MKGRTIIMKTLRRNWFWQFDIKERNARGKKDSWAEAEAKRANRTFRRMRKNIDISND